jgi:hypothetical protein
MHEVTSSDILYSHFWKYVYRVLNQIKNWCLISIKI